MKTVAPVLLVVLLGAAVFLAATNPTTEQYATFLETSLPRALERMDEKEPAGASREQQLVRDLLRSQGTKLVQSLARGNTTRRNYGLFSIFETTVFGVQVQVLGAGNRFVPLEEEQELIEKFRQALM